MLPTPLRWLSTPVSSMARVGEHEAEAWKLLKRTPRRAKASMLGVAISPPKAPTSVKPQSSASSTTILGRVGDLGPLGAGVVMVTAAVGRDAVARKPANNQ